MIVTYLKLFYTFAKIGMFTIGGDSQEKVDE